MERFLGRYSEYLYALMRIFVGLAFSCNGARKLFGVFGGLDGAGAAAQFPAQYWFAGVIEFFCGVLVAIGLFTGYAAFIASGEMAVAYFQNHFPKGFWPILNTGERAVFYCFTFLYISGIYPAAAPSDGASTIFLAPEDGREPTGRECRETQSQYPRRRSHVRSGVLPLMPAAAFLPQVPFYRGKTITVIAD